ncbi:MAG: class A beta-lactamase-related serine hydrolase [Spirochaetaceae bacterium]|nr:MAG: class A beta-lactamase-related serine hydrolase [Spirochaetaceae bacterium]
MAQARNVATPTGSEYPPRLPRRPGGRFTAGAMFRSVTLLSAALLAVAMVSVAGFGLVGCAAGKGEFESEPGSQRSAELEALIAQFDREVPRLLDRYDIPGAAVALVRHGEPVWSGGYGYADLDAREPVDSETVFEAGSIAKSITAWTVLRLVDQGKLALDDAVITHLPDSVAERFRAAGAGGVPAETLTVGELISNSGGMPFALGAGDLEDLREGRMDIEHLRRRAPSGERFEYSNPAFVMAALMVERVSDAPFAEVAQREVLDPLGMQNSGFGAQPRFAESAATGHTFDGTPVRWDNRGPPGAGGFYSTATDLARFLAAYHAHHGAATPDARPDTETVLSASAFRAMLDPVIRVGGAYHTLMAEYYALGHFVDFLEGYPLGEDSSGLPVKGVTHGGESTGWLTAYYTIPQTGDGFVLLTNSRRSWPLMRLARTWVDALAIPHPTMVQSYYRLRAAVIGFGAVTAIAAAGVLLMVLRRRKRPWAPTRLRARIGAAALVATGAALLVGWWAIAHGVVSMFFPVLVALPAAGVTLLALVLVAANLPLTVRR